MEAWEVPPTRGYSKFWQSPALISHTSTGHALPGPWKMPPMPVQSSGVATVTHPPPPGITHAPPAPRGA
jgi:hypothetical protein